MVMPQNPRGGQEAAVCKSCEWSLDVWEVGTINVYLRPLNVWDGARVKQAGTS